MGSATVATASVTQDGKGKAVTARHAQTPACPTSGSCAAEEGRVSVGFVSALSQAPTEQPARSALPAPTPAP